MLGIIRDISVNTFKQDPDAWLYKGIITGCLKIAHQSVFTDANNFTTFNINSKLYSSFFGFTQEETDKILCDFGVESKRDEIKKWCLKEMRLKSGITVIDLAMRMSTAHGL